MSTFDAIDLIEGFKSPSDMDLGLDDEEIMIQAWQHLIDTGIVWQLQGSYGRMAMSLIKQGICVKN